MDTPPQLSNEDQLMQNFLLDFPCTKTMSKSPWLVREDYIWAAESAMSDRMLAQIGTLKEQIYSIQENIKFFLKIETAEIENIKRHMYAGLLISMWAKMESYFKIVTEKETIKEQIKKIKVLTQKEFCDFASYDYVNALRIINNKYKHTGGIYDLSKEKNGKTKQPDYWQTISPRICRLFKIQQNEPIPYEQIPIEELSMECHHFWMEFFELAYPDAAEVKDYRTRQEFHRSELRRTTLKENH